MPSITLVVHMRCTALFKDNLQAPSDLFDEVAGTMEGEDITLDSGLFCPSVLSLLLVGD